MPVSKVILILKYKQHFIGNRIFEITSAVHEKFKTISGKKNDQDFISTVSSYHGTYNLRMYYKTPYHYY